MQSKLCVYPGSFDPVTCGHINIIERACALFAEVRVAVLDNPEKTKTFTVEERKAMLKTACAHLPNVRVDSFSGLLVDYMKNVGAGVVIRGLRSAGDFEVEFQMAQMNRQLSPAVDSIFLMTEPQYAHISSSMVKQVAAFGGDISAFVPAGIQAQVIRRFRNE